MYMYIHTEKYVRWKNMSRLMDRYFTSYILNKQHHINIKQGWRILKFR